MAGMAVVCKQPMRMLLVMSVLAAAHDSSTSPKPESHDRSSLNALGVDDECLVAEGTGEGSAPDATCSLHALQRRSGSDVIEPQYGQLGIVAAIYTFGAPATAEPAFPDLARADGIFQGLRLYTENVFHPGPGKQIDGAAIFDTYLHPKVATAVLHWGEDSYYIPGAGKPEWPQIGGAVYADWNLHKERNYVDRLSQVKVHGQNYADVGPFAKARMYAILAFKAYDSIPNFKIRLAEKMPGWKLVAQETQNTLEALDKVWLVQDGSSLECALVFTGTTTVAEFGTSITQSETGYCGFPDVHAGYRNKLYWVTKGLWPKMRPKLGKCSAVTCVGHSLGGSLCDIFAGCANSKRAADADYQRQMWTTVAPEAMPEI